MPDVRIFGDWVAEYLGECTCGGGILWPHEPGCGYEPVGKLGEGFSAPIMWDFSDWDRPWQTDSTELGVVDDGFGSSWLRCKADCGLQVVRPGKVQCDCDYQAVPDA